jgi:hypothetical protein
MGAGPTFRVQSGNNRPIAVAPPLSFPLFGATGWEYNPLHGGKARALSASAVFAFHHLQLLSTPEPARLARRAGDLRA